MPVSKHTSTTPPEDVAITLTIPEQGSGAPDTQGTGADSARPTQEITNSTHHKDTTPNSPPRPAPSLGLQGQGAVSAPAVDPDSPAARTSREGRGAASKRWAREGRDQEIATFRDRARKEFEQANSNRPKRDAYDYAWDAALAAFPPEGVAAETLDPLERDGKAHNAPYTPIRGESGQIQGLSEIPADWPELPANAMLQSEIGWVQANRLLIVKDKPGGATVVDLSRALEPAPSRAALGWLETSIRAYSKYVDIVARSLATQTDEQGQVRRERMAIDEIRALLNEMHCD